jgi:hypothetical protein
MSRIRANTIVNGAGTGAPNFPRGAIISGISTINADLNASNVSFSGITTTNQLSLDTGSSISGPATNTLALGTNDVERLRIRSNGHVAIGNDIANDNAMFKVDAADGQSDDQYVGQFINREATASRNYGVNIQAGSNSTDHGFRVRNGANDATHFQVRGDGYVTKPNQPGFFVSGSFTLTSWNGVYYPLWSDSGNPPIYDIGDNYSDGVFTAPVDGRYLFSAHFLTDNGAGYLLWSFYKNTSKYMSGWHQVYDTNAVANETSSTGTLIIQLSANDTVTIGINASHDDVYTPSYNYFTGYLLG